MLSDEIIALLTDNREGLKVSVIARRLEPKSCGARIAELCFMVDRECAKMVIRGTLTRDVVDGEPFYIMRW